MINERPDEIPVESFPNDLLTDLPLSQGQCLTELYQIGAKATCQDSASQLFELFESGLKRVLNGIYAHRLGSVLTIEVALGSGFESFPRSCLTFLVDSTQGVVEPVSDPVGAGKLEDDDERPKWRGE